MTDRDDIPEIPERIYAPFSNDQVAGLNFCQQSGIFHPFTCGGDRCDSDHQMYSALYGIKDFGVLIATSDGWICPCCDYRQNWAHKMMSSIPDLQRIISINYKHKPAIVERINDLAEKITASLKD